MADLLRISIVGAMPSGEEWSINPSWRINTMPETVTPTEAAAIAAAIDALTIPAALIGLLSSSTTVTGCRVEARTLAGDLEAQADHVRGTPVTGAGPDPHPFQTSLVVSLRTPLSGPRGRGRAYWPATGAGITSSSLRLDNGQHAAILAGFVSYFEDITTAITASVPDCILGVWSRSVPAIAGVTSLRVGDVFDTQRRRRDIVPENYLTATYPSP